MKKNLNKLLVLMLSTVLLVAHMEGALAGSGVAVPVSQQQNPNQAGMHHAKMKHCCPCPHDSGSVNCLASCFSAVSSLPAMNEALFAPSVFQLVSHIAFYNESIISPPVTSLFRPPRS